MKKDRKFVLDSDIEAHYESGVEKDRLIKDTERLEFHRTKQIISRYLPKKPATILDIGAGPGVYTSWLAEMGHIVHLVDPTPLHVTQAKERMTETGISKFASAIDGSRGGYIRDPDFMKIIQRDLKESQHRNPGKHPQYFTTAYFHHPSELGEEVREAGFGDVTVFAVEGFAWLLPDFEKLWTDDESRERLLSLIEATETEPSLIGVSAHLLCVGQKR